MEKFFLGDTLNFTMCACGLTASEHTAQLILKRPCFNQTAQGVAGDGEDFTFKVNPDDQIALLPGLYEYYLRVTNIESGDVSTPNTGKLLLLPDPSELNDVRTQYEKDLEAVEEAMRNVIAGGASKRYRIHTNVGERELERMDLESLQAHHRWIKKQVNLERVALGKRPLGADQWRTIKMCVGSQSSRQVRRR